MSGELEEVRNYLEKERQRLRSDLDLVAGKDIEARQDLNPVVKQEETAAVYSELEKRSARIGSVKDRLDEIERALGKIADGTYGLCDECGGPIAAERLAVLPQTSLCVSCKSKKAKLAARVSIA